jgi:tripartite-type tricarboxylate transporter receptor subunit TctC
LTGDVRPGAGNEENDMKTIRPARRAIIATGVLLGAASLFNADAAFAQAKGVDTFPSRPVRMIVPFAPGGPTDIVARLLAQRLGEIWGQTVLIDNRPGAGGNLGVEIAAKAAPDGYTILVTSSSYLVNPALYEKLRWDPFKSFVPVTNAATSPNLFVVHPSVPAKSMKELIALIKSQPGKFSYASPGLGTTPQLSCEMFKALTGVDVQHVPYGGAGPATTSVVGNQNPMGCMAQPPDTTMLSTLRTFARMRLCTSRRVKIGPSKFDFCSFPKSRGQLEGRRRRLMGFAPANISGVIWTIP